MWLSSWCGPTASPLVPSALPLNKVPSKGCRRVPAASTQNWWAQVNQPINITPCHCQSTLSFVHPLTNITPLLQPVFSSSAERSQFLPIPFFGVICIISLLSSSFSASFDFFLQFPPPYFPDMIDRITGYHYVKILNLSISNLKYLASLLIDFLVHARTFISTSIITITSLQKSSHHLLHHWSHLLSN